MDDLAWIINQEGHAPEAEKLQRATADTRRRVFGLQNLDTLKSMSGGDQRRLRDHRRDPRRKYRAVDVND
jgi:hypothetical protein